MNCSNCGKSLSPDEKFCSQCGAPRPVSSSAVPERFMQVEAEYVRLKGQLAAGQITHEQLEAALKPLMFQDEKGHYWMIGVESGKWHMHDGQQWLIKDPPIATTTAPFPTVPPAPAATEQATATAPTGTARLVVTRGSANMPSVEFGQEGITIGRATANSLVLNDGQVSRLHARIDYENGVWSIRDLNSRNGTFVNGKRIAVQSLRAGDQIAIGVSLLIFQA